MAISTFECKIITGGFSHCDVSWNKTSDELDRCFKIYNPVKGEASINIDGIEYPIESDYIYFISGFNLKAQKCTSFIDIYWLHFIPTSIYLRHILLKSAPIHSWKKESFPFLTEFNEHIKSLFNTEQKKTSNIYMMPYSFEEAKLQSYILNFVANILKLTPKQEFSTSAEINKLKPSIDFMNNEFKRNPTLSEIAQKSALAPNYFHRIFKKNFGLTPLNYMLRLRMEIAVRLLTTTSKSVKEIAFDAGYSNEFYFYRQFKKHYNYSPGKLKKMRPF